MMDHARTLRMRAKELTDLADRCEQSVAVDLASVDDNRMIKKRIELEISVIESCLRSGVNITSARITRLVDALIREGKNTD